MKYFLHTAFLIFTASMLCAGESPVPDTQALQDTAAPIESTREQAAETTETPAKADLPTEYRSISLGMSIDAVKEALKKDTVFGYRGERDVSMQLTENRSLIESHGTSFISRSWFQFYKDNLYTMIFKLNTDRIDYYSVYSVFCEKYGEPSSITPQRAVWENEHTRTVIERPLIVKYIDMTVFNELIAQSNKEKMSTTAARQNFLDEF